jgi:uncharacterized damage-inducible protein DinB
VGGGDGAMTRGQILLHLVNHTSYHRGFVADLFYQLPTPVRDWDSGTEPELRA